MQNLNWIRANRTSAALKNRLLRLNLQFHTTVLHIAVEVAG